MSGTSTASPRPVARRNVRDDIPVITKFRENPFLPTMSESERRQDAYEEQRREELRQMIPQIRQELIPEIRSMMRQELEAAAPKPKADSVAMKGSVDAVDGVASGLGQPLEPGKPGVDGEIAGAVAALEGGAAGAPSQPAKKPIVGRVQQVEGAKFIACINGKALFKQDEVTFIDDENKSTCGGF